MLVIWAPENENCLSGVSVPNRVGFLPEEIYFFQDAGKKVEKSYFLQFIPDKTGRNGKKWKKLKYPKL